MKINNITISNKNPFIVAEILNHAGKYSLLKKTILAAIKVNDAVKLQSYSQDDLTLNSYKKDFGKRCKE